jgi:uncharacterized protein (TIGR04255 family)
MAQPRHLCRAPITEALVDLRAAPSREVGDPRVLGELKAALTELYPNYSERRAFEAQLEIRKGQAPVSKGTDKGFHGHFFESGDGRNIAQFRVDGFTYNRLAPYTDWETVTVEALRLWDLYAEVVRPLAVSRVAVRYINMLPLSAQADLATILTRVPSIPEGARGELQSFLTRVETLDAESGRRVITTQAVSAGMPPENRSVVIDIDAFQMGDLSVSSAGLRPILDDLRQLKNAVFFGSITEEAAKGFE